MSAESEKDAQAEYESKSNLIALSIRRPVFAWILMVAFIIFGAIGWYAGSLGERLARRPAIGAWLDRAAGGIFVALGLCLLISR